jgi:hypothetical protein
LAAALNARLQHSFTNAIDRTAISRSLIAFCGIRAEVDRLTDGAPRDAADRVSEFHQKFPRGRS